MIARPETLSFTLELSRSCNLRCQFCYNPWKIEPERDAPEMSTAAVLRLVDDEATRMRWPHAFEAELTVRVAGRSLEVELACTNTGSEPLSFTAALHSYLRVKSLHDVSLFGLAGQIIKFSCRH